MKRLILALALAGGIALPIGSAGLVAATAGPSCMGVASSQAGPGGVRDDIAQETNAIAAEEGVQPGALNSALARVKKC